MMGSMATSFRSNLYFSGIDAIRFSAALFVVGFHLGYLNNVADMQAIWPVTWFGWIGVEVFFVISGFVIANSANGRSAMQFLRGRALRLYPAVWCCATITFAVRCIDQTFIDLVPNYLRSIALLPKGPWIDDVYWTLAVEIGFYTLIFILLWTRLFSWLSQVSLALTALSAASVYTLATNSPLSVLVEHANVILARHGCFFAVGVWIWISTTRSLAAWEITGVCAAIFVCLGETYLRGTEFLPSGHPNWLFVPMATWGVAVAAIFAISRHGSAKPSSAFLRTLGLMTYPLYLVHHVVGIAIERAMLAIAGKWIVLAVSVTITVAISWAVCRLAEPRIRNLVRRDRNRIGRRAAIIGS
jgi:exopolysaccharide production protein ExoZ